MNLHLFTILLLILVLARLALAGPENRGAAFDAEGRFAVEVAIPEGARHAVLEISPELPPTAPWRSMIGCSLDGRASEVTFRLPPQPGGRMFARVKTGPATTIPPVELSDPALASVSYPVSQQAKVEFLMSAAAKMREWKTLPRPESQSNLIAWSLTHSLVQAAELSPLANNISIRFDDGTTAILLNKKRAAGDPDVEVPQAIATSRSLSGSVKWPTPANFNLTSPTVTVPATNRAVTAFSLESHFPNSSPTVSTWLSGKGYQSGNFPTTTVSQIKNWAPVGSPLGVLFWHVHGCSYKKSDGTEGIALVTGEYAHPASNSFHSPMVKAGELNFAKDDSEELPYYAVTSKFVRNHMRFAPHSIVVLDSCCAAAPELANEFISAGAGSYCSWDWLSGDQSGTPCLKIFDRLLGTNEEPPISTPKERAFSLPPIMQWMSFFKYDVDPSPRYKNQSRANAKLTWYHHPDTPGHMLRPSVMRVLHEFADAAEPFTKFLIEGDFGTDPGPSKRTVLWGGVQMPVLRWNAQDGIVIRIPASPPVGNIQVNLHDQFSTFSNQVPLTQWNVPFTYEVFGKGSLYAKMEMNVKFRGDIHGSRGMPEMPPEYLGTHFSNVADCTGAVTASGSHQPEPNETITWSGGSTLFSVDHSAGGTGPLLNLISNHGTLNLPLGNINPFSLTANGSFTETEVIVHNDGSSTTHVSEEGMAFAGFAWPVIPPKINPVTSALLMETRFFDGGNGSSAMISWPSVIPSAAPNDNTAR